MGIWLKGRTILWPCDKGKSLSLSLSLSRVVELAGVGDKIMSLSLSWELERVVELAGVGDKIMEKTQNTLLNSLLKSKARHDLGPILL